MPTYPKDSIHERGIIASLLEGIASNVIGLAYEGISSFLHHKTQKALCKVVKVMEKKTDLQCNKIHHLEDNMTMYNIYNSNTLAPWIETIYRMHNNTTWRERAFPGKLNQWFELCIRQDGIGHYTINSILFLTTIREKCLRLYERFLEQLRMYANSLKRLFAYFPVTTNQIRKDFEWSEKGISENKDYDLVLRCLYLYYNMKLVTFGIDEERNLIIQFPVFVQPYTKRRLVMYQIKTVPIPVLDKNEQAQSYTHLKINKPYIAFNSETCMTLCTHDLDTCKE